MSIATQQVYLLTCEKCGAKTNAAVTMTVGVDENYAVRWRDEDFAFAIWEAGFKVSNHKDWRGTLLCSHCVDLINTQEKKG